jgi:hypothetical protein
MAELLVRLLARSPGRLPAWVAARLLEQAPGRLLIRVAVRLLA